MSTSSGTDAREGSVVPKRGGVLGARSRGIGSEESDPKKDTVPRHAGSLHTGKQQVALHPIVPVRRGSVTHDSMTAGLR